MHVRTEPRRAPSVPSCTMRAALTTLLASSLLVAGCITERTPISAANRPGGAIKPNSTGPNKGTPVAPAASAAPVASAAPGAASVTTRVAASIKPLGPVPYDGLTLPLISPDGTWLITQTGSIPPWEAVLAEPGSAPVPGNAVQVFRIGEGQPQRVSWPVANEGDSQSLPSTAGLLLGRCAGDGWVLVEKPNEDGSRWIGRLDCTSGQLQWLVQGKTVNAHALLLRDGTLVYTRRNTDQASSELVFIAAAGTPAAAERIYSKKGVRLCQPIATPDQTVIAVTAIDAEETQIIALSASQADPSGAPLLIARQSLGPMSAAAAFQAVTSIEACPPDIDSPQKTTLLFINADRRRLTSWDPLRNASTLLPAGVAAGVRVHGPVANGLVMASAKGVDFWTGNGPVARLIAGGYIPRSFGTPQQTRLVLLAPAADSATPTMNVVLSELVAPNP